MSNPIRQEVSFKASAQSIYEALTCAKAFNQMSEAPAEIDAKEGGAFTLFGGMVQGRTLELVPNQRIVQAWRAGNWPAGAYSVIRFDLKDQGGQTVLNFEQVGYPAEMEAHLTDGWKQHYWGPLKELVERA